MRELLKDYLIPPYYLDGKTVTINIEDLTKNDSSHFLNNLKTKVERKIILCFTSFTNAFSFLHSLESKLEMEEKKIRSWSHKVNAM
jgi:hypothetical protein